MRRPTRAVLALPLVILVLAVLGLWASGPATAGGPTSVLVSVPGEGRLAALSYTQADYGALSDLVGIGDPGGTTGSQRSLETGQVVTLTWLIHDVQVWRVDTVHLAATGAPWVETREVLDGSSVWEAPSVWHRADRRLVALLKRVVPEPGSTTADDAAAVGITTDPALGNGVPAPRTDGPESGADDPVAPLPWAATGLVAGAVLTLGLLRLTRRRASVSQEEPGAATDRLAWP